MAKLSTMLLISIVLAENQVGGGRTFSYLFYKHTTKPTAKRGKGNKE